MNALQWLPNPLKRQRTTPPPEVVRALAVQSPQPAPVLSMDCAHQTSLLGRLHFKKGPKAPESQRPVIVVPAPARPTGSSGVELENLESGDEGEWATERSRPTSTCMSADRDADLPPDAVLNAINVPQHTQT